MLENHSIKNHRKSVPGNIKYSQVANYQSRITDFKKIFIKKWFYCDSSFPIIVGKSLFQVEIEHNWIFNYVRKRNVFVFCVSKFCLKLRHLDQVSQEFVYFGLIICFSKNKRTSTLLKKSSQEKIMEWSLQKIEIFRNNFQNIKILMSQCLKNWWEKNIWLLILLSLQWWKLSKSRDLAKFENLMDWLILRRVSQSPGNSQILN